MGIRLNHVNVWYRLLLCYNMTPGHRGNDYLYPNSTRKHAKHETYLKAEFRILYLFSSQPL